MAEIVNNVVFWIMITSFIIAGCYVCLSLRVPPEYRTNDKK